MNANNEPVADPILAQTLCELQARRAWIHEQTRAVCVRTAAPLGKRGGERLMLTVCACGTRCDGDAPDLAEWSIEEQFKQSERVRSAI